MRMLLVPALLLLACAGHSLRPSEPIPDANFGRDQGNPAIPKTSQNFGAGFEVGRADPTVLIAPGEGLVETDGHYRLVRPVGGDTLQAVDGNGERFAGQLIHARSPRFGEPEVGTTVFYLERPAASLRAARSANWTLGRVEGQDAMLGKVIISGHAIAPSHAVLIPTDPVTAK